jgi:hypothetical protein
LLVGSGIAIVVGNAAPELEALKNGKNLFRASEQAAAGILEGLRYFGAI